MAHPQDLEILYIMRDLEWNDRTIDQLQAQINQAQTQVPPDLLPEFLTLSEELNALQSQANRLRDDCGALDDDQYLLKRRCDNLTEILSEEERAASERQQQQTLSDLSDQEKRYKDQYGPLTQPPGGRGPTGPWTLLL